MGTPTPPAIPTEPLAEKGSGQRANLQAKVGQGGQRPSLIFSLEDGRDMAEMKC
jgi:hypothetical protein